MATLTISAVPAVAQVKLTHDQMMFYTSGWKGDRFSDGRPKLPDKLLQRALNCTFEDLWGYMRAHGYNNQYEGSDWKFLHLNQPFSGRALTAQYMPTRPDMRNAIDAEGKAEGRVGNTFNWPIDELVPGDVYVADTYDKVSYGPIIGSNLANSIYAHSHNGFVFYGAIRDQEEEREIKGFNGIYRHYDPTPNGEMVMTKINGPIRIGQATVLPGDLVLVKNEGALFIPAQIAEEAVSSAEFTSIRDAFGFAMLKQKKYTNGQIDSRWTPEINAAFVQYVNEHPELLEGKMMRSEFDALQRRSALPPDVKK
jgi:4-hydroxy-4-methyl-2-oxoglutarate aldolase